MALTPALERIVAAALAATVFAFACGSTIVDRVLLYGRPARWICLAVLVALALVYAAFAKQRRAPPAFVYIFVALVAAALVSTFWSVDPRLTAERGTALAALALAGVGVLRGSEGRVDAVRRLLLGLLAGIAAVAVTGVVVLIAAHGDAVQPATYEYPARFRGFGQNPNTAALLLALGIPLAMFFALDARSSRARLAAIGVALLFAASITASGSRGAMLGGLAGALVLVLGRGGAWRRRTALAALCVAAFAVCLGVSRIPDPKPAPSPATAKAVAPTRRTLFSSSGRRAAWRGAIRDAAKRPLLGYGYGTEERAFVNRYAGFASELPENSYIGASLQLGLAGLALLLLLGGCALGGFVSIVGRLSPHRRAVAAACAGTAVAALVVGVTQSYLFSVGNIATTTAWLSMFLLVSVTQTADRGSSSASGVTH